jgi:hypothetical protein
VLFLHHIVQGNPKGQTLRKRCWAQPKCNNDIRDQGLRQQLCLGSNKTFYEALGQIIGLEVMKQAVEFAIGLQKMSVKTLWRSQPPPKGKKRLHTAKQPEK